MIQGEGYKSVSPVFFSRESECLSDMYKCVNFDGYGCLGVLGMHLLNDCQVMQINVQLHI